MYPWHCGTFTGIGNTGLAGKSGYYFNMAAERGPGTAGLAAAVPKAESTVNSIAGTTGTTSGTTSTATTGTPTTSKGWDYITRKFQIVW